MKISISDLVHLDIVLTDVLSSEVTERTENARYCKIIVVNSVYDELERIQKQIKQALYDAVESSS